MTDITSLQTMHEVATCLFEQLDARHPLFVDPTTIAHKKVVWRDIQHGHCVATIPSYYIKTSETPLTTASNEDNKCGKGMVHFLITLGSDEPLIIPMFRAVEIMVFWYWEQDLRWVNTGCKWRLESTPEFEKKHHKRVRLRWPSAPLVNRELGSDILDMIGQPA